MSTAAAVAAPPKPAAPPPSTPPKFVASQLLDISTVEADPHNPRKDFPKEEMNALINSVMLFGVRQPIEVRVVGSGKHRIVFGERRYRAAKAADLKQIPAIVRTMTDLEASEVQLAENLERADLSPLEIAGGYQRQLELGRTIDQVCERAGKKRSAVYAMLQLLQLGDAGRKALGEERITTSVAQLVARVPKALQERALSIVEGNNYTRPLTFKQAEAELGRVFLVDLNKAPWKLKDEGIPCVAKSCFECPKRSGNAPDLFPDVKNRDACTDPVAYRQKLYLFAKADVAKAGFAKLLNPNEHPPEKLFYNGGRGGLQQESGYVDPDERCYDDTQNRPYKQLLTPEQRAKLFIVALDADGKQRHLLERAGLMREVKKAGLIKTRKVKKASTSSSSSRSSPARSTEPAHYREPPPDIDELVDRALVEAMVAKVEEKGFTPQILKVLALELGDDSYQLKARRFGRKNAHYGGAGEKMLAKLVKSAKPNVLAGIVFEGAFDRLLEDGYGTEDLAKGLGVSREKLEADVKKANPVLWSEDAKGATGSGVKNGAEYLIEKKDKAFVFKKPKEASELSFDSLEKAKATAVKVELGQAVWKAEEPTKKPSLKELVSGKGDAVTKAVAKHAAKKGGGK